MASMQSPILKNLKLDTFYRAPLIYDQVLEITYPESIYTMKPVYGMEDPRVKVKSTKKSGKQARNDSTGPGSAADAGSQSSTAIPSTTPEDPSALVAKQKRVLSELKVLRAEVDSLEKLLHKDKQALVSPLAAVVAAASVDESSSAAGGRSLQEKLKNVASDKAAMQDVIVKEETAVLSKLEKLRRKLDDFRLDYVEKALSKIVTVNSPALIERTDRTEFVIFADPKHPPLSFRAIPTFLSRYGDVVATTYVHSSADDVSDKLRKFLPVSASACSRYDAKYNVSVIWKNVGKDPVLDPHAASITGEVNIIRHILQSVDKDAGSPSKSTETNKWFEMATKLSTATPEELQNAMSDLDSHLDKSPFLMGEESHLLDALVHSVLHQTDRLKSIPGSMSKWLKSFLHE